MDKTSMLLSFLGRDDYSEGSGVTPVEDMLEANGVAGIPVGSESSQLQSIAKPKSSDILKEMTFNPLLDMDGGSGFNMPSAAEVDETVDDCLNQFRVGEKLVEENGYYAVFPLTPLNGANIFFGDTPNQLDIEDYWKVVLRKVDYRFKKRFDLARGRDFEYVARGPFRNVVLKRKPERLVVEHGLFPDGIEDFRREAYAHFEDGCREQYFYAVNALVSEAPNVPAMKKAEYAHVIVKPLLVDLSGLYGTFVTNTLGHADREAFIETYIDGLFYMLAIEHRVLTFDAEEIDRLLLGSIHRLAFNQDYTDERHLPGLYDGDSCS